MSFFDRLKEGLKKTSDDIAQKVDRIFAYFGKIDQDLFDELEQALIESDIGIKTTDRLILELKVLVREQKITDPLIVKNALKGQLGDILKNGGGRLFDASIHGLDSLSPAVITVVGVNGAGKTSTIAKIAYRMQKEGKKVLLAAADTYRAAAIDQLAVWSDRTGTDMIRQKEGSDPAAVVFDAIQAAKARKADVLICDTAGRLHTKKNLMDELGKIERITKRELPESPKETLLVLDATTGQNAVSQARIFKQFVDITGIVLTKLDGTAKGGIIIAIMSEMGIPVKLIGIGENMDDLQDFEPDAFIDALF